MEFEDMAQSKALTWLPSTSHHCRFVELHQSLQSRVEVISPFLNQLMFFIASLREADGSAAIDIELALREALTNAVVHGNHQDPDRHVYVVFRCSTDGEVSITIRDQGQGFDSRAIPDPTAPEELLSTHGRGIYLMRALMDEVCFEEGGAVVHMRKKSNKSGTATLQDRIGLQARLSGN
jgi:serine/threonine-protein kinase RsbW